MNTSGAGQGKQTQARVPGFSCQFICHVVDRLRLGRQEFPCPGRSSPLVGARPVVKWRTGDRRSDCDRSNEWLSRPARIGMHWESPPYPISSTRLMVAALGIGATGCCIFRAGKQPIFRPAPHGRGSLDHAAKEVGMKAEIHGSFCTKNIHVENELLICLIISLQGGRK